MKREHVKIRRALISVYDKTGIVDFANFLQKKHGVSIVSTGGTAKTLRESGLHIEDVSEVTGFPECFGGRVKTLHPRVHGPLLFRRHDAEDVGTIAALNMEPIDLVVVNLYPFKDTIAKPGTSFEEAIEQIDIGGPSMLRSGAKNFESVTVTSTVEQYLQIVANMDTNAGSTTYELRRRLAAQVFKRTAEYDAEIAAYLESTRHGPG